MKKLMLVTAMVLGLAGMSLAQSSASAPVTVNATVIQGLTLAVTGATGFGTVVAGTTPATDNPNTPPAGMSAALITATGNGGNTVTVTFAASALLTGTGAALTFTPTLVGDPSNANQGTAAAVASGGTVTLSGVTGSAGNYYFWLGGSLAAIPANEVPGSYSGTLTLTVSY